MQFAEATAPTTLSRAIAPRIVSHPFNHGIIGNLPPPAPSILDFFRMIGESPAVCIPKDASVSSHTITSPIVPASTDLSLQDHGRAAALEFSIFKRGEDGITGQDVIQSPRANFFTPHRVVPCASSLSLTPMAWPCPPDIFLNSSLIVQLGSTFAPRQLSYQTPLHSLLELLPPMAICLRLCLSPIDTFLES